MLSNKEFYKRIGFVVEDKYRLELRWSGLSYSKGECLFKNATFGGPTIKYAEKIEANNSILIDLYKQFFIFAKSAYIATLSWGSVVYSNDLVYLGNAKLVHTVELNKFPKLLVNDYIVINTLGHDSETHAFYPTYMATVVNSVGTPYNFWDVEGRFRKANG